MNKTKKKTRSLVDITCGGIHRLFHSFCDFLQKDYYELTPHWTFDKNAKRGMVQTKRKFKELELSKVTGYEAMCKIEKFITKNPDIIEVACDDSVHASSCLYLIPHENEKQYWGTTVLYVPQCTTDKNTFFLYPNHLDNLIKELQKIKKRQILKGKDF